MKKYREKEQKTTGIGRLFPNFQTSIFLEKYEIKKKPALKYSKLDGLFYATKYVFLCFIDGTKLTQQKN